MEKNIEQKKTVVVKIGSALVLNKEVRDKLLDEIDSLKDRVNFILVVSGAVGLGTALKPNAVADSKLKRKQYLAGLGQTKLIRFFEDKFGEANVSQVLVTHENLNQEYISTLKTNVDNDTIPVVNENDAVSVKELCLGDNDQLGAHTAAKYAKETGEDVQLVLLTSANGVLKRSNEKREKRTITSVNISKLNREILDIFERDYVEKGTDSGTGGILSKVMAAIRATHNGVKTTVANGEEDKILSKVIFGENISENDKRTWTNFMGKLNDEQINALEEFISENNLDIPDWDYENMNS